MHERILPRLASGGAPSFDGSDQTRLPVPAESSLYCRKQIPAEFLLHYAPFPDKYSSGNRMLSSRLDSALAKFSARRRGRIDTGVVASRSLNTPHATVQYYDSGSDKPCVILVPDGPNVIAHYEALIGLLKVRFRVVCFDMPGFGYSTPAPGYDHSLNQGAATVIAVMDELNISSATLAFSCANGFYALRVAQLVPDRISRLLLSQTPSLAAMHAWSKRIVPRVLHLPVLGQAVAWAARRKAAGSWYRLALPKGSDASALKGPAMHALACGGCFCLAGVVQGLAREDVNFLGSISTPCTILWGSLDRSHQLTDPNSFLDLVPDAEIIHFENCGHFPDIEQPERFARVLVERAVTDCLTIEQTQKPLTG